MNHRFPEKRLKTVYESQLICRDPTASTMVIRRIGKVYQMPHNATRIHVQTSIGTCLLLLASPDGCPAPSKTFCYD